jgi:pimeloyl-ACP methyl ester carboxylesterase
MKLEIISKKPEGTSQKPPILFVHGAWHGAWCWNKYFLPYFAQKGYVSYALSLRGHGNSDTPRSFRGIGISDYVADVKQVIDQLPEKPILVGHSMGGLVTQKYLENNSLPAAVLLASVPVKGVLALTFRIARRHPLLFLKANLTLRLYPLVGSKELAHESFFSEDMEQTLVNEYFRQLQDESYRAFLDILVFRLPKPERVNTDLLVLGAEKDAIFTMDEVKQTAAAYGTTPEFFNGMAHDMMLEKDWQKVADRIIAWLEKKGI